MAINSVTFRITSFLSNKEQFIGNILMKFLMLATKNNNFYEFLTENNLQSLNNFSWLQITQKT